MCHATINLSILADMSKDETGPRHLIDFYMNHHQQFLCFITTGKEVATNGQLFKSRTMLFHGKTKVDERTRTV
jgi:hypothetical protein